MNCDKLFEMSYSGGCMLESRLQGVYTLFSVYSVADEQMTRKATLKEIQARVSIVSVQMYPILIGRDAQFAPRD